MKKAHLNLIAANIEQMTNYLEKNVSPDQAGQIVDTVQKLRVSVGRIREIAKETK